MPVRIRQGIEWRGGRAQAARPSSQQRQCIAANSLDTPRERVT